MYATSPRWPRLALSIAAATLLHPPVVRAQSPPSEGQRPIFDPPLSPRIANYDIQATLDDQLKHIDGHLVLTWNNPSDEAVEDLQFHLYANAFKSTASTQRREAVENNANNAGKEFEYTSPWKKKDGWGWLRVGRMRVDGQDVTDRIQFFQPDDQNADDQSVIRILLPTPIAPRASARIEIDFDTRLPRCKQRMGWWGDDFFLLAHWFPKIGVYETPGMRYVPADAPKGQWNCHQFHAATEFYADYGVYNVSITLPDKYVVGTTGLITAQTDNGDGTKTLTAHAEDVHEFAWVAQGSFLESTRTWQSPSTDRTIDIRLLYRPDHTQAVERYLSSVVGALDHIESWLGADAYPYPNLTVVDPPNGSRAGGMEYPNLITGGASWWRQQVFGQGLRGVELVTIHEFMHQIWYGIVGNNEFEEAWLDEGLTTYSERRISAELFGAQTSLADFWGFRAGDGAMSRLGYAMAAWRNDGAIADVTFRHWNRGVAGLLSYSKTGLMLKTLENYLGREQFDQAMRAYYRQWRFGHPARKDFITVFNETSGQNLDWFFDQILKDTGDLDYAVASIASVPVDTFDQGLTEFERRLENPSEIVDDDEDDGDDEEQDGDEDDEQVYDSKVVLRRVGQVVFPVEVLIEFSDQHVVRQTWDGRDRIKTYRFTRPARIVRAVVDPDHKVPLDVNRLNNSRLESPNEFVTNKYTLKGFFWMQSLLQFFSTFG